jgi:ABC-type Mn2+/Zn2+ transport system ATPase subunit
MTALAPVLDLRDVVVKYERVVALEDATLHLDTPAAVGVVGPNGAGKSTLLKAIAGLVRPVAGSVRVFGQLPYRLPPGTIGYVPQLDEIERTFPVTVRDVVAMGRYPRLRPLQALSANDRGAIEGALHDLGLGPLASRRISELSGGQQQRTFLARALCQEPRLLLLDEPTTGVDAATEEALRGVIRAVVARGIPVVMTTHDLDDLGAWFDRVIVVNRRIVADGAPGEIDAPAASALPRRARLG